MDPFIGQIMQVGFNFAPTGWALCNGAQMAVSQNQALFSLLGTTFGGNGQTTFLLPDLQGRVGVGVGQGAGLPAMQWGEKAGVPSETLTLANLPAHTHSAQFVPSGSVQVTVNAYTETATASTPAAGSVLATPPIVSGSATKIYAPAAGGTAVPLGGVGVNSSFGGQVNVGATGSSMPINVMQPYLGLYTIIALQGIYPSRG